MKLIFTPLLFLLHAQYYRLLPNLHVRGKLTLINSAKGRATSVPSLRTIGAVNQESYMCISFDITYTIVQCYVHLLCLCTQVSLRATCSRRESLRWWSPSRSAGAPVSLRGWWATGWTVDCQPPDSKWPLSFRYVESVAQNDFMDVFAYIHVWISPHTHVRIVQVSGKI